MIKKIKLWLLTYLIRDDALLNLLYIKQIVTHHVLDHEERNQYRFKVEINNHPISKFQCRECGHFFSAESYDGELK